MLAPEKVIDELIYGAGSGTIGEHRFCETGHVARYLRYLGTDSSLLVAILKVWRSGIHVRVQIHPKGSRVSGSLQRPCGAQELLDSGGSSVWKSLASSQPDTRFTPYR
jgi:hypothetical protein